MNEWLIWEDKMDKVLVLVSVSVSSGMCCFCRSRTLEGDWDESHTDTLRRNVVSISDLRRSYTILDKKTQLKH